MSKINTIKDVFGLFKTNVEMSEVLSITPSGVSEMKRRMSIPVEHWPILVKEAKKRGRDDVTMERLAIVSAKAAREKSRKVEAAE
jgi:hypothetical protein